MRGWLSLLLCLTGAACSDGSFNVQRGPEFPKAAGTRVSVLGVYRDGRLAPEAWDPLRTHLSPLFGKAACDPGYPDILTASGNPLLQTVDDFTRANGVPDELIDRLAPAAKGDLILLLMETGRPGVHADSSESAPGSGPATLRAGGRRGGGGTPAQSRKPIPDASTFEMVAVVFSVHAHKSVGAIRMSYSGTSLDEAFQSFFGRLGSELPGASCEGWKGDRLHLDVSDVQRLQTE